VKLHIYGDGPERGYLEELIEKYQQPGRIILKGRVDHKTLLSRIEQSLFFILPSLSEVSPNLALECIGLKKPIILTKETGILKELPDKIKIIDPMDSNDIKKRIEELLNDDTLKQYKEYLQTAPVKYRDWQRIAGEQLNIFIQALKVI
jgi:glycosyltransferase involved in cell wall biosynthesis